MKLLSIFVFFSAALMAQVPQGIPYQAIARNGQGQPLANLPVKVRFSVLDSTASGPVVYSETHVPSTSAQGLFSVNVGMGNSTVGSFSSINWGVNAKFLKVELDTTASGNNYVDLGTQQMMSVPYALVAGGVVNSGIQNTSQINRGLHLDSIIPFFVYGYSSAPTLVAQINLDAGQGARLDGTVYGCGGCGGGGASVVVQAVSGQLSTVYKSGLDIPNAGWNFPQSKSGFIYFRALSNSVINIYLNALGTNSYAEFEGVIVY